MRSRPWEDLGRHARCAATAPDALIRARSCGHRALHPAIGCLQSSRAASTRLAAMTAWPSPTSVAAGARCPLLRWLQSA
eukprot:scaffold13230_cov98-Isochrysis_galbana.AAC.6